MLGPFAVWRMEPRLMHAKHVLGLVNSFWTEFFFFFFFKPHSAQEHLMALFRAPVVPEIEMGLFEKPIVLSL